jgi:hypothetical protein
MKNNDEVWYKDVIGLGFTEEVMNDSVFEARHGFKDSVIVKHLTRDIMIEFEKLTLECRMIRTNKEGLIVAKMPIKSYSDLEMIISFFR